MAGSFAIVDKSHVVKNIGRGPWCILGAMKDTRLQLQFWFMAMSGTIISSNSRDIVAPIDILSSASWGQRDHASHAFRAGGIQHMGKALDKSINNNVDAPFLTEEETLR